MGYIVNGWELNSILYWRTGFPFTISSGIDNALTGVGRDHADQVKAGNSQLSYGRSHAAMIQQWFDTSFFAQNAVGTFGNTSKNILRGPRFFDTDLSVIRNFQIKERAKLQFRSEFFNVFNNVNFNTPDHNVSDSAFGQILSAKDPRIIQFALKFAF
jgi:hypothetical protein